jgi:hypothetical protein
MENNENLVIDEIAENTENTAEEIPTTEKTYTQSEVDAIVGKAKARTKAKIQKEVDRKYGDLENVLKAGMGKEDVGEIADDLREFYGTKKGIKMPEKSPYSTKDIEVLAKADADEIIGAGFDEVVEETDRLSRLGATNMTARDKALLKALTEYRQNTERGNELAKIGVTEDVYNSREFQDFASKFNSGTPIRDIYDIYAKTQPKKEVRTMGSMKNSTSDDGTVKDFYTRDEALQFTKKDLDKNPALYKAIEASMLKW